MLEPHVFALQSFANIAWNAAENKQRGCIRRLPNDPTEAGERSRTNQGCGKADAGNPTALMTSFRSYPSPGLVADAVIRACFPAERATADLLAEVREEAVSGDAG
jgi:hypothetical protein